MMFGASVGGRSAKIFSLITGVSVINARVRPIPSLRLVLPLPPQLPRRRGMYWLSALTKVLLFVLVASLSATVDVASLRDGRHTLRRGIALAMACQFLLLPALGFCAVRAFRLGPVDAVMLLVITSSPGGSYSNWWCSLLNADLALSVACTAVSTLASAAAMPLNLLLYLGASAGAEVVHSIRWSELFLSIFIVTVAVAAGLALAVRLGRHPRSTQRSAPALVLRHPAGADFRSCPPSASSSLRGTAPCATLSARLGLVGNLAGFALILMAVVTSSASDAPLFSGRPLSFYAAGAAPALLALPLSLLAASAPCARLSRPQRVAVAVEVVFQNVGFATSLALSLFPPPALGTAVGLCLWYGMCQTTLTALFTVGAWKAGWTHAPASANFMRVLTQSWQPTGACGAGEAAARAGVSLGSLDEV